MQVVDFLNKGFSAWFDCNLAGPWSSMTHHHSRRRQQWRFAWTLLTSVVLPNTKPTICTLDSNFWSLLAGELLPSRAGWRIHPLIIVIGESKATRTGLHDPPPLSRKKRMCKHQAYANLASTETQDTFINNCWNTNKPNGAVAYVNRFKCCSEW